MALAGSGEIALTTNLPTPKKVCPSATLPPMATIFRILSLWLVVSFLSIASATERLAVLELSGDAAPKEIMHQLSDSLRAGALNALAGTEIGVMTRESIAAILSDMGLDSACVEGQCEVETARNLRAAYVVSGGLINVEGTLLLSLKLHDARSGSLLNTARERSNGSVLDLIDQAQEVGYRLVVKGLGLSGPAETITNTVNKEEPLPPYEPPAVWLKAYMELSEACHEYMGPNGLSSNPYEKPISVEKELAACREKKSKKMQAIVDAMTAENHAQNQAELEDAAAKRCEPTRKQKELIKAKKDAFAAIAARYISASEAFVALGRDPVVIKAIGTRTVDHQLFMAELPPLCPP